MKHRPQFIVLAALLITDVALVIFSFAVLPLELINGGQPMPAEMGNVQPWVLGLANGGVILVGYGLLGFAGYWLARRIGLPGIFRTDSGWREWLIQPLWIGAVAGVVLVIADQLLAEPADWPGFPHPEFPFSIIASATAGIGEEILFRLFVMSLWAFLLNLILKRWDKTTLALWIGNGIAALAFGAAHLPAAMLLLGATTPAAIPPIILVELFLLNGIIAMLAGERYMKNGLVAAVGIHFWADMVWHVIWPLLRGAA